MGSVLDQRVVAVGVRARPEPDRPWSLEVVGGSAADLHGLEMPDGRVVRRLVTNSAALVLGSTQSDSVVDPVALQASSVELARRRSGGGVVLVVPEEMVWIDIHIERGDPLWDDDVVRAAGWVGRAWQRALGALGYPGSVVHEGGLVQSRWSNLVCFAGLGPGELTLDGQKLLGVSQRRTRDRLRLQCAVHQKWNAAATVALLALSPPERAVAEENLSDAVAVVDASADDITGALVEALPG